MLQRIFYGQLPDYARPDHPVMRHTLHLEDQGPRSSRHWLRRVAWILGLIILLLLGYQIATSLGTTTLDDLLNPLDKVFLVLYWPLVFIQIAMRLAAFGSTTGSIGSEVTRGTWDTLKITTDGASLSLRTRWASVFYQLRYVLLLLTAARLFFIFVALIDFAQFQGHYLDLLISGTVPLGRTGLPQAVALGLGVLVVALQMTAALIAPFTAVAFDAALGTLLGTLSRGRWMGLLSQVLMLLIRVWICVLALWFGALALGFPVLGMSGAASTSLTGFDGNALLTGARGWLGALFGVTEGDLGLTLLYLPNVQRLFADLEFGALIGVAALVYFLIQAWVAKLMLGLAVRRAIRADRT